jgi:uroporphyrinogen decarboxylase
MRQAGRYMAEYRELKTKHSFLALCKSPELSCEVTMQPIRYLNPDAAILFADILLPLEAMGLEVAFNPGPQIGNPIRDRSDIEKLRTVDVEKSLGYVFNAVAAIRKELDASFSDPEPKALLGFAGAPWTMACYMLDQTPFKHFMGTQVFAARSKESIHLLLETMTPMLIEYLTLQAQRGADAVQLFDTWAGNLTEESYREFALPYTQRIVEALQAKGIPVVVYVNGSSHLLQPMLDSGATAISVDSRTSLKKAHELGKGEVAIQGNFDPCDLFLKKEEVISKTKTMLESMGTTPGYLVNLGHGILQTTPPENVKAFVDTVREFSA